MHELPPTVKLGPGIAGVSAGPRVQEIDARWLMAYAAALGETAPEYFDTERPEGIIGHPLFPVCYEWPLALEIRARTIPDEVSVRGVHATHDLAIHRRARAGDRLSTRATVTLVEPRSSGAYVVSRFETADGNGQPVSTTIYGSLYRGVSCESEGHAGRAPSRDQVARTSTGASEAPGPMPDGLQPRWSTPVTISATLAHVYTECARIWNPIHTDRAVAHEASLPDIILHGTATLALAVSETLRREAADAAAPVHRISCRFRGMVRLPSTLTVEGLGTAETGAGRWIRFRAVTADGGPAVDDGLILAGR